MKIFILSFVLFIELILQGTVFQFLNFNGFYPDLILITIVCYSIILGKQFSYKYGFIIGLLADILYGNIIGVYALSFLLTGYLIGVISTNMFKESLLAPISLFPIGVITSYTIIFLVYYFLKMDISIVEYISKFKFAYWVVNFITIIILYPLLLKLIKKYILKSDSRS